MTTELLECQLRENTQIDPADVARIALGLKSLAAYSSLAYDHDDDPEDLQEVVDQGLEAIERIFEC